MTKTSRDDSSSEPHPSEFRRPVIGSNQIQLPARLVREVGFESPRMDTCQSAKVGWYYHDKHDKAVLANDTIDRPSLEPMGSSALYGVSNEDLESGEVSGARVTIISDLPQPLYDRLTRNALVLKPIYSSQYSQLNGTCVSVYPAGEYDRGTLPNVQSSKISTANSEMCSEPTSEAVGNYDSHQNSV